MIEPNDMRVTKTDFREVAIIAIAAFVLIIFREPKFLMAPRLWGEEGTIYIQSFLDNGLVSALFAPHLGYYSLVANVSAVLGVSILGLHLHFFLWE